MLSMKKFSLLLLSGLLLGGCRSQMEPKNPLAIAQADLPTPGKDSLLKCDVRAIAIVISTEGKIRADLIKNEGRDSEAKESVTTQTKTPNPGTVYQPDLYTHNQSTRQPNWVILSGIPLGLAFGHFTNKRVKRKARVWAAKNKWAARGALVVLHGALAAIGFSIGKFFSDEGLAVPAFATAIPLITGIAAILLYPSRASTSYHRKRAIYDKMLIIAGFLSFACLGNTIQKESKSTAIYSSYEVYEFSPNGTATAEDNADYIVAKILLTLLALALAYLLFSIIGAVACNLACSGMQTAANLVLIAGGAAILFLLFLALREIWKKREPETTSAL